MPLIKDHAERNERAAQKRHALLRFLRDELYNSIGCRRSNRRRRTRCTTDRLANGKLGLVRRHVLPVLPGFPPVTLIAITSHGQAMAF